MIAYSGKIQKAIRFAITAHDGQTRKGKDIPYITHPLTVALILSQVGASEDVIVAGILHDVVEDSDVELDDVQEQFGEPVADLVKAVTEEDKGLPWETRKRIALGHIKDMNHDALLLKSADVLHNLLELVHDGEEQGDVVFEKFNAPKEEKLAQQQKLVKALESAWPENPLLPEIREGVKRLTGFVN
ncbi:MAG: hypothetical protein A3E37_02790 [Candidatus Andersenbacteria bacterium RIFCSPHIGHO2_12_FULL_46_9]|nr:MAG: metal dependent phosphohydrolase [Parcubacteria group bacterium GW2011_GWA2_45_14]OGY33030.1 MAG: hypothetical protein A3B76_01295 [Candidatus Andersenbacteria bacterium RIFCSPHIGHO2_02_FULL_46_16]OGY36526.1 MAG: hypothetical protein A3E37_02790 [Candidatus Andersenbacteria bacterium RIFCSPHIGHO2_12_FULL_46_9]OGY37129.1 MAG: hypothetical protein A3I08_02085 [Candidatus Andersenbacteria bacterium RIFCSPLOWO2_02_FULL_46_11]OGY39493.1 MAG: hypothetical protein A3G57_04230 [Candidatus Ander